MDLNRICASLLALALAAATVEAADTLYDERFKRWTREAEAGDATAQYNLGNAYMRGLEVARDYRVAAEWFAKAAAQNDAKAQYKLGYLHFEGKGVARDYKKAYQLLRKSAQQEYSPAQFYLGRLYAEGLGVEQDNRKALYWFTEAAEDNYSPAKKEVERLQAVVAAEEKAAEAARRAKEAAAAANKPKPKPRPEAKQAKASAPPPAPEKPKVDHRKLFLTSNWVTEGGSPSKHMPSELTRCTNEGEFVVCKTDRLRRTSVFARVDYMVEAKFGRFTPKGEFMGSYRENVLFVLPDDPDNPNPSEEDVPTTGWKVRTVIKCKFEDPDTLSCVNDNFRRERFVSSG